MQRIYFLFFMIIFSQNCLSGDFTIFSSLGYGNASSKSGVELTVGGQKLIYEKVVLDVIPLSIIIVPNDGSRYRSETTSNNKTICRDKTNGQFSDSSNCGPTYKYAFQSSVKYQVHESIDLGLGTRIGSNFSIYADALLKFNSKTSLEGKLGNDYTSISIRFDF